MRKEIGVLHTSYYLSGFQLLCMSFYCKKRSVDVLKSHENFQADNSLQYDFEVKNSAR